MTYKLSKEASLEVIAKISHALESPCSAPLCPCGLAIDKAIVAASELYVKNTNQKIGREAYLMAYQGSN
jgi:hypothetical protein